MTPGARVAAAIAVVERWLAGPAGLDRVLADWGRGARYAGSGDRRAVADLVYGSVRRLRSALWVAGGPDLSRLPPTHPARTGRAALLGAIRLDGSDPAACFTGEGHAPPRLSAVEAQGRPLDGAPEGMRLDLPDWLLTPDRLGDVERAALDRLRQRAPVHLRVNLLKGDPATAIEALLQDGIEAERGPLAPTALALRSGERKVARSRAFADGLVEVQDAASQAVVGLCAACPGDTVLDLCAGGGGKILALASAMAGQGRLIAHDISPDRLAQLAPRARRAGADVACRTPGDLADLTGSCDLVLVDAPCSGSGAWARNPDAKWRLTPERLAELADVQDDLLRQAGEYVRPGGRLVYATCSLMPVENDARVDRFLTRAPLFRETVRHSWTPLDGGDGFFAAVLVRTR